MRESQRKREWECELPDGRKVEGVLPDSEMTIQALTLVPKTMLGKPSAINAAAGENLLRVSVRKIGGQKVPFTRLRGRGWDRRFSPNEQQLLLQAFQFLTSPTEAEKEYFDNSVSLKPVKGEYHWTGAILENEDLRTIHETEQECQLIEDELEGLAEELEDLEDDEERADIEQAIRLLEEDLEELTEKWARIEEDRLIVRGRLPGAQDKQKSVEQVDQEFQDREYLVQAIAGANLLRNCLLSYQLGEDGERVELNYETLEGNGIDRVFEPKEQQLLLLGIMDMASPSKEEQANFLKTVKLT